MRRLVAPVAALAASGALLLSTAQIMTQRHEGAVYKTYRDPVGILTACYGHTGPELRMGQKFNQAQCDALFRKDWSIAQKGVRACVRPVLNQNQADALTSFVFNVGQTKFCRSTMARKVNAGDMPGAAAEFSKWVYAGKPPRKLPGLIHRRQDERALFLRRADAK